MTVQEFQMQVSRLRETYGKDKYPETRVHLFWERFKNDAAVVFERSVSRLIAESRSAPMIHELSSSLEDVLKSREQPEEIKPRWESETTDCEYCEDTGGISGVHKENGYKYTFRCCCKVGASSQMNWPFISLKFYSQFDFTMPIENVRPALVSVR